MTDERPVESIKAEGTDPYADFVRQQREEEELYAQYTNQDDYLEDLKGAYGRYITAETFQPGDVVEWKRMLRNLQHPRYGAPAIVVSTKSDGPHDPEDDLDIDGEGHILIGFLDGNQVFRIVQADPARLERWKG